MNDGTGGFGPKQLIGRDDRPLSRLVMDDVDGDLLPDAIVTTLPASGVSPQSSEAVVYRNLTASGATGAERFVEPTDISESFGEGSIVVADFNQDGREDLVAFTDFAGPSSFYLEALPGGTFASPVAVDLGLRQPADMQVIDIEQDGDLDLIASGGDAADLFVVRNESLADIGTTYCAFAVPNSTGEVGAIEGYGGTEVFQQELELTVTELPANVFGFFLTSRTQAFVLHVPGSLGTLCLGGSIGRFVAPGQIQHSGPGDVELHRRDGNHVPLMASARMASRNGFRISQGWTAFGVLPAERDLAARTPSTGG